MLEFLTLKMFLCVLTGEGKEEKIDSRCFGLGVRFESEERVIWVVLCWNFIWVT